MSALLSVVIPVFNESAGIEEFYRRLQQVLEKHVEKYEVLFCNDGSTDTTLNVLQQIAQQHDHVRIVSLSRNFGKEAALAAGFEQAKGSAIIAIDSDGQHPPELIPDFIESWKQGNKVVVGVRTNTSGGSLLRRMATATYYRILGSLSKQQLHQTTDYCLIDESVKEALHELRERNRINRGLIEWLGFKRAYITFEASPRIAGSATYSLSQLAELARNSIVSASPLPLYFFGIIGAVITPLSFLLGIVIIIQDLLLDDPLGWKITGTAMLGVLIIFLVGLVLMAVGMLSVYIWQIHTESKRRPLYVIDKERSHGLAKTASQ